MADITQCGAFGKPIASTLLLSSKTYLRMKRLLLKRTVLTDGVNQRNSAEYHNKLNLIKELTEYFGSKDIRTNNQTWLI